MSRAALAAVLLALAGCAVQPTRTAVPVDPAQAHAADARRGSVLDWNLSGRIAVSNAGKGGSGRIDWHQQRDRYTIALSAPVTRQSWRLSGDAGGARLEGVEGGPRESAEVEGLLMAATGWDIPVRALSNWVRGIGAATDEFGPAEVAYGPDQQPVQLKQAGWSIEYQAWQPADAGTPMPVRLVASRGQAKVRLIVDEWALEPAR